MPDKMKKLIERAACYLHDEGYTIGSISPNRGVDLIVFKKGNPNKAIFVAVMDGDKTRSIPLQGLGTTQKALVRSKSLLKGVNEWIKAVDWKGSIQEDVLWISTATFPGGISHHINIGSILTYLSF